MTLEKALVHLRSVSKPTICPNYFIKITEKLRNRNIAMCILSPESLIQKAATYGKGGLLNIGGRLCLNAHWRAVVVFYRKRPKAASYE